MIQIKTIGDRRIFSLPSALVEVALELFGSDGSVHAIYQLACKLSANDLHTAENIAIHGGHCEAVKFAKERLLPRFGANAVR